MLSYNRYSQHTEANATAELEMNDIDITVTIADSQHGASYVGGDEVKVGEPVGIRRDSHGNNPQGANAVDSVQDGTRPILSSENGISPWEETDPSAHIRSSFCLSSHFAIYDDERPDPPKGKKKKKARPHPGSVFTSPDHSDRLRLEAAECQRLVRQQHAEASVLSGPLPIQEGVSSDRPVRRELCVDYQWTEQFPLCAYPGCKRHMHWHCWACNFVDMCRYCRYSEADRIQTLDHDLCGMRVLAPGYQDWCLVCFNMVWAAFDLYGDSELMYQELGLFGVRKDYVSTRVVKTPLKDATEEHKRLMFFVKSDPNREGKQARWYQCRRHDDGVDVTGVYGDCPLVRCDACYSNFPCSLDDCGFEQRFQEKDRRCVRCSDGRTVGIPVCPFAMLQGAQMRAPSTSDLPTTLITRGMFGWHTDKVVPVVPFGDRGGEVDCLADMYGHPQPAEAPGEEERVVEKKSASDARRTDKELLASVFDKEYKNVNTRKRQRNAKISPGDQRIGNLAASYERAEFKYESPVLVKPEEHDPVVFLSGCLSICSMLSVPPVAFNLIMNVMRSHLRYEHGRRLSCVEDTCLSFPDVLELEEYRRRKTHAKAINDRDKQTIQIHMVAEYTASVDPKHQDVINPDFDITLERHKAKQMRTHNFQSYGKGRQTVLAADKIKATSHPEDMTITDYELSPSEIVFRNRPPGLEKPPQDEMWTAWNLYDQRRLERAVIARPVTWPTDKLLVSYVTDALVTVCDELYETLISISNLKLATAAQTELIGRGEVGTALFRSPCMVDSQVVHVTICRISFLYAQGYVLQEDDGSDNSIDSTENEHGDEKEDDAYDSKSGSEMLFSRFAKCPVREIVRHCRLTESEHSSYLTVHYRHVGQLFGDNVWAYLAYAILYVALELSNSVPPVRLFVRSLQQIVATSKVPDLFDPAKLYASIKRVRRLCAMAMEYECRVASMVAARAYTRCRSVLEMEYVHFPPERRLFAQLRYACQKLQEENYDMPNNAKARRSEVDVMAVPGTNSTFCVIAWRLNLLFAYVKTMAFGPNGSTGAYIDRNYDSRGIRNRGLHDMLCSLTAYRQPKFLLSLIELTSAYDLDPTCKKKKGPFLTLFSRIRVNAILGYDSKRDSTDEMLRSLASFGIDQALCKTLFDQTRELFDKANLAVRVMRDNIGARQHKAVYADLKQSFDAYCNTNPSAEYIHAVLQKDALFSFPEMSS